MDLVPTLLGQVDDNLAVVIMQLAARPDSPVSLQQLVEIARTTSSSSGQGGAGSSKEDKIRMAKDKKVLFSPDLPIY